MISLIFPNSVLENCTFLEICPFLLGCPFYWHIIFIIIGQSLCISVLTIVTSPFSSYLLHLLSFSLDQSGQRFINFVCLFKEPPLMFIDLSCRVFSIHSFLSALVFTISSTKFGHYFFFFQTLSIILDCFCKIFLVSALGWYW